MRVFLGFDYDCTGEAAGEDWAIALTYTELPHAPQDMGRHVYETPERDAGRLFAFVRRLCGHRAQTCALLAADDDFTPHAIRAVNLDGEAPETLAAGDFWAMGWFLRPGAQLLGKRFSLGDQPFAALALETDEEVHLLFACRDTPDTGEKEPANTKRAYWRQWHAAAKPLHGYRPSACVADGVSYSLDGGSLCATGRHIRFLRLFWRDMLPPDWQAPAFLTADSRLREDVEDEEGHCTQVLRGTPPALPVRSLTLRFDTYHGAWAVQAPFAARTGAQDEKIVYSDPETREPRWLFVEGLRLEDVCADIAADPRLPQYPQVLDEFRRLCPPGKRVLSLCYENPFPQYSPQFYFQEELEQPTDAKWPPPGHPFLYPYYCEEPPDTTGSSMGIILRSEDTGPHGLPQHRYAIHLVDENFTGAVALELFSVHVEFPAFPEIKLLEE